MGQSNLLTVLKYLIGESYQFYVLDKFDEPDEAKRLDRAIEHSNNLRDLAEREGLEYKQIWIKTVPALDLY